MDTSFLSEHSSIAYNATQGPNNAGHNYSACQPRSESQQLEYDPYEGEGLEYLAIQQSVPNTPNDQTQFNSQAPFHSNGFSHSQAHGPRYLDTSAAAGWGGPSRQEREIMNHLASPEALFSSALQGLSSQTIGPAFLPSGELSIVQDFLPNATLYPSGQVHDVAQSHVVTPGHGPNAPTQAFQKAQEKKHKDKLNKRDHRSRNAQDYEKICALLNIPLKPKNWLARRILEAVQKLVEQHEEDNGLRAQLREKEAELEYMAIMDSTQGDSGSSLPSLATPTRRRVDTETLCSWFQSNGERIERGV